MDSESRIERNSEIPEIWGPRSEPCRHNTNWLLQTSQIHASELTWNEHFDFKHWLRLSEEIVFTSNSYYIVSRIIHLN